MLTHALQAMGLKACTTVVPFVKWPVTVNVVQVGFVFVLFYTENGMKTQCVI